MSAQFLVRSIDAQDQEWVREVLRGHWGSERVVTRGRVVSADTLPGFVAVIGDKRVGLIAYVIRGDECEVVSLTSERERCGIGSALLAAAKQAAEKAGCRRVCLITSNDNTPALRFYQKRGMHLAALYPNALEQSRSVKSEIPVIGLDGIPLRDEIELEYVLR